MRKLLSALPVLLFLMCAGTVHGQTTDFGFDFRGTLGYVTDPSYASFASNELFPHTYTNGASATIVAGWSAGISGGVPADRDSSDDPRLAGIVLYSNGSTPVTFTVTLPMTGTWNISLAMGDAVSSSIAYVKFADNSTTFSTITASATTTNAFIDPNNSLWSAAAWPGSNTTLQHTFTSTTFVVTIGAPGGIGADYSRIAHLRVTLASPPPTTVVPRRR